MRSDSQKIAKNAIVKARPAFGGCPLGDAIHQRCGKHCRLMMHRASSFAAIWTPGAD
jgi:hypothetical protein